VIPVSAGYLAAQASNEFKGARRITLYRRNWSGSGWEGVGIDITNEVMSPQRLSDKLDTEKLNEFKIGNLAVSVDNKDGLWVQGSTRFPNGTFLLFRSKVVVELGMVVGGVPEIFPRFTGIIEDMPGGGSTPTVNLDIRSTMQMLESADADKAALTVLAENLGTGDGVAAEFLTDNSGVAEFRNLVVGGNPLRPGQRWSQGQLDDPNLPGKVSFASEPEIGESVLADYLRWKRDKRIEDAVADLVAVVADMGVDTIQAVTFTPPPVREIVHTTQGDFIAYTQKRTRVQAEAAPPLGDGVITLDPLDTKAEWDARINSSGVNNGNRVPNGLHPLWRLQYEATHLPEEEYHAVEGVPLPFTRWQETVSLGSTRSVSNSILTFHHAPGFDSLIHGLLSGGPDGNYFSIRARIASNGGSAILHYAGYFGSGPQKGATIRVTAGQVALESSMVQTFALDTGQFHTYEVFVDTVAAQARLKVDGVQVLSQVLGTSNPNNLGISTVDLLLQDAAGSSTYEIDFMRFNNVEPQPPLLDATFVTDYDPHLGGLTSFSLITTLGPFFAVFQGGANSPEFFWSSSNDGINFGPETAIPLGGNVGAWTGADFVRKVRLRVKFREGADPVPGAMTQLWLPGIAHLKIDGGTGVQSWDTWTQKVTPNNGAVQVFTAGHHNLTNTDSFYAALGVGGAIQSDNDQFLAGFGMPTHVNFIVLLNTAGLILPQLREGIINLTTNQILLTLANYGRGSKVLAVLREITGITDRVIGVNGNGSFFFKARTVPGSPSKVLDDSNVLEPLAFSPGWEGVFNIVRATFGNFRAVADAASVGEGSPTSENQFGDRPLDLPGTSLLFQKDVDLATALVKKARERLRLPKRRLTVRVRWMPEVELLDRVTYNVVKPRQIGPANLDAIVAGATQDPEGWTTELDLLEI